jgi:hypothetical protein
VPPSRDRSDDRCSSGTRAGDRDDDLLARLAAPLHPAPAAVEPLLAAPGALDGERVLPALAAGELGPHLRAGALFEAASTSSRRR